VTGLLLGRNVFYASDNLSYDGVCNLLLQGDWLRAQPQRPVLVDQHRIRCLSVVSRDSGAGVLRRRAATGLVSAAALMATRNPYFPGEVSFSIHLIHDPCRPVALELLRWVHFGTLTVLPTLGIRLAGSFRVVPLAWILHVTVERPGRRAVRGLRARWCSKRSETDCRGAYSFGNRSHRDFAMLIG
jgi:hypothetical protein